jgi:autotransporter-associated beta strand protein
LWRDDLFVKLYVPLIIAVNSVSRAGAGTWALSGKNTCSCSTTVSDGKLLLIGEQSIADDAILNIAGGKIEMETRERVGILQFDGTNQLSGIWASTSSRAKRQDNDRFIGEGVLYVSIDFPSAGTVLVVR